MNVIGYKEIKRGRKNRACFWCGQIIELGQPYVSWCWVENGIERINVHPECRDAWHKVADEEGGFYETMPYEHARGRTCAIHREGPERT